MPDYKTFARGIHVSRYQKVDWDIVGPHIDFAFCKASDGTNWKDPTFVDNVQALYDRNIPCFAFHYFDGDYYPSLGFNFNEEDWIPKERDAQLQNMVEALTHKAIYLNAVDVEETTNMNTSPGWMSEGAKVFTGRASDWLWQTKQKLTLVYTRQSFINDRAPNMNNWVHYYDQWVSQPWQKVGQSPEVITWEQVESRIPPNTVQVHPMGAGKEWRFWQWSIDRYILPGIYTNDSRRAPRTVCLEMFNGTVQDLHKYCGFVPAQKPVPPPVVVPPVVVGHPFTVTTDWGLVVRPAPGSKEKLLTMPKGTPFIVTEFVDNGLWLWGKHERGWSALYPVIGRLAKAG
jgi:hypothetical protein